jgi:phosphonatase-like hydrolase
MKVTTMTGIIELAVFDIAGTTVEDRDFVSNSFIEAFTRSGISITSEEIRPLMGYRKREAIAIMLERKLDAINESHVDILHESFVQIMTEFYLVSPHVSKMSYAEDIFHACKQRKITVALNSGFPKIVVDAIMERTGWLRNGLVDHAIASDEVPAGRPHPYMINKLMYISGVSNSESVIKIGDTVVDILEGRNASCGKVVAVTTGAEQADMLKQYDPDFLIHSLDELRDII